MNVFRTLLCLIAAPLAAQPLTLAEAIDAALESEPSLALALAERDAASAVADEAAAALDPHLSFGGSIFVHDEPMVVRPIHGFEPGLIPPFDRTLIHSSLTASWLAWDGGGTRARRAQAEAMAEAAEAGTAQARQRLIARTVAAYLDVLTAAATLEAEDARLTALDSERARVDLLRDVGRAAEVEVLRVDAARAAAEAERTRAAARLDLAVGELARTASIPRPRASAANLVPPPVPDGPIADAAAGAAADAAADAAAVDQAAFSRSPRVEQARRRLAAEKAALAAARAGRRPRVDLASSLLEYGSGEGDFTLEWNAGVQVRFNAFDGGAAAARIGRARAEVRMARARLALAEDEVSRALERASAGVAEAEATRLSLERAARQFAEVVRIERLRLEHGAGTQTDYLRAEADLVAARAALALARQRVVLARVELARAAGILDVSWIAANFRSDR